MHFYLQQPSFEGPCNTKGNNSSNVSWHHPVRYMHGMTTMNDHCTNDTPSTQVSFQDKDAALDVYKANLLNQDLWEKTCIVIASLLATTCHAAWRRHYFLLNVVYARNYYFMSGYLHNSHVAVTCLKSWRHLLVKKKRIPGEIQWWTMLCLWSVFFHFVTLSCIQSGLSVFHSPNSESFFFFSQFCCLWVLLIHKASLQKSWNSFLLNYYK